MSAILFALVSYIGWGAGDIFGTIATRKIGPYSTTLWSFLIGLVVFSLYIPFAISDLKYLTFPLLLLNAFLGILLIASVVFFNEGLRTGNAALVGTISSSFTSLVVILSIIFLGDRIGLNQVVALIIIFIGLTLSSLDFKSLVKEKLFFDKSIAMAFLAMLGWGIYFTFIKILVDTIGWFWPGYLANLALVALLIFMRVRGLKVSSPNKEGALKSLFANSILLSIGAFAFNLGIQNGLTSVVTPISGAYPTLFVVLAFLVFKDPIKRQQIAGIITTLIGIVLLSAFSV